VSLPDGTVELRFEVGPQDLADAMGSGEVSVLATPRLIAWLEAATMAAAAATLEEGATSVGTRVAVEHLAAVGPGSAVTVWARLAQRDGRVLTFDCGARTDRAARAELATGRITRAVVDRASFASQWG
jgi:fluoroacetyl-CoA thioesterase